ncbi:MAG: RibD family protein [candidate division Zixibacteria bacterium]|nr:RibD family protein [candidate division Zixibacteria bacterium]
MPRKIQRPSVTIKFAQSLDGRIATLSGDSKWISGPKARAFAHRLRSQHQAVLVGINTVLKDNPRLTVRLAKGKNPVKVILDSRLRVPLSAHVVRHGSRGRTIVAVTKQAPLSKIRKLQAKGLKILLIPSGKEGGVSLKRLLAELKKAGIQSVLVEGGAKVITSFLKERLAYRLIVITAPKIIGKGIDGINFFTPSIRLAGFERSKIYKLGDDIVSDVQL